MEARTADAVMTPRAFAAKIQVVAILALGGPSAVVAIAAVHARKAAGAIEDAATIQGIFAVDG